MNPIPFVDIFAGPGGLGEGFSSFKASGSFVFKPVLSIEKEFRAYETLTLRSFFRQFRHSGQKLPQDYYEHLQGNLSQEELYARWPNEAQNAKSEAWQIELGGPRNVDKPSHVSELISKALGDTQPWILLGGPPCQAYSLVGRSRMGGIRADDPRVTLYKHYLHILASHQPAAFIFENVKGLASTKLKDRQVFQEILKSLNNPTKYLEGDKAYKPSANCDVRYRLYGLAVSNKMMDDFFDLDIDLTTTTIRAEDYGIPQARHRIIILGVREDLNTPPPGKLMKEDHVSIEDVIGDLPRLRSGLSKIEDNSNNWVEAVQQIGNYISQCDTVDQNIYDLIKKQLEKINRPQKGRGSEFLQYKKIKPNYRPDWYVDNELGGVCNHITRAHLVSDLHRYFFAAVYAIANNNSPKLHNFPKHLLPNHCNAAKAVSEGLFSDRFRVQLKGRPATTITSHISKDGHYFIHYDPTQCRSLTVREAARIQTFPDNYFFCGPRTSQYLQVGNAVPPLLANKIAAKVYDILTDL